MLCVWKVKTMVYVYWLTVCSWRFCLSVTEISALGKIVICHTAKLIYWVFFLWGQFSYIRGDVGMYSIFKCFFFRENEKWTSVLRTVKKTSFKVGFKKSILFWIIFSFLWYPYKLFILENGYTNYLVYI